MLTNIAIHITPNKKLKFEYKSNSHNNNKKEVDLKAILKAFTVNNATGLLTLLKINKSYHNSVSVNFFYNLAQKIIFKILHCTEYYTKETELYILKKELSMSDCEVNYIFNMRPPLLGCEYFSKDTIIELYSDLFDLLIQKYLTNYADSTIDFIAFIHNMFKNKWSNIGQITFHLSENKHNNSDQFPFVFMATIINNFSDKDEAKHLPIAVALEKYSQQKSKTNSLLKPLNNLAKQNIFFKDLITSKRIFKPLYLKSSDAYHFFNNIELLQNNIIIIKVPNIWKNKQLKRLKVAVNFSMDDKNKQNSNPNSSVGFSSMLKFSFKASLNNLILTELELKQLLEAKEKSNLIQFKGEWVIAEQGKIDQLLKNWQKLQNMAKNGLPFFTGLRLLAKTPKKFLCDKRDDNNLNNSLQLCAEACENNRDNILYTMDDNLRNVLDNFKKDDHKLPNLAPNIAKTIRPYQSEGVNWLWRMSKLGLGCCLADDMGLGKTLQVLTFLELQKRDNLKKCSLLVVPASLLKNWQNECLKFTPQIKLGIIHNMGLSANEFKKVKASPEKFIKDNNFDIVITTYHTLMRLEKLQQLNWGNIIIDEAQAIKNAFSQQSMTIRNLKASFKIALTGTPIENSLLDLWSIFDFINPSLLGDIATFKNFLKELEVAKNDDDIVDYSPLRKLTSPFILRRLKTDKSIINDLPDKSEINVYCNLEKKQLQLYQRAVRSLAIELKEHAAKKAEIKKQNNDDNKEKSNQRNGLIFKYLMAFKQICNHPAHFTGSGNFADNESGKFAQLISIASQLAERQEKVLVFTQFREMIEPIHDLLAEIFKCNGLMLHGGTSIKKRGELVDFFQNNDDCPFFVLSLKAAGTGLNLTAANHVIHFDRWWNPAVENQATDRAFRIGQHRNVLVHKFVTTNTIEERIAALIASKQTLANNLFTTGAEKLLTEMSDEELLKFIALT